jgi:hypothetical protein
MCLLKVISQKNYKKTYPKCHGTGTLFTGVQFFFSVLDPYLFDPDPYPQNFRLNTDPDPG